MSRFGFPAASFRLGLGFPGIGINEKQAVYEKTAYQASTENYRRFQSSCEETRKEAGRLADRLAGRQEENQEPSRPAFFHEVCCFSPRDFGVCLWDVLLGCVAVCESHSQHQHHRPQHHSGLGRFDAIRF